MHIAMITIRDYLQLKRVGIDILSLSVKDISIARCALGYKTDDDFVHDLIVFVAGQDKIESSSTTLSEEDKESVTRIVNRAIYAIPCALELTLYEAAKALEERARERAERDSVLLATICNVHCHDKSKMVKPKDFDPWAKAESNKRRDKWIEENNDVARQQTIVDFIKANGGKVDER